MSYQLNLIKIIINNNETSGNKMKNSLKKHKLRTSKDSKQV